jgi:hypothetical protein
MPPDQVQSKAAPIDPLDNARGWARTAEAHASFEEASMVAIAWALVAIAERLERQ